MGWFSDYVQGSLWGGGGNSLGGFAGRAERDARIRKSWQRETEKLLEAQRLAQTHAATHTPLNNQSNTSFEPSLTAKDEDWPYVVGAIFCGVITYLSWQNGVGSALFYGFCVGVLVTTILILWRVILSLALWAIIALLVVFVISLF